MNEAELGWLAGIFDGEGCIWSEWSNSKRQVGGSLCILAQVEACSEAMIMRYASLLSEAGIEFYLSKNKPRTNPKWRQSRQLLIKRRSETLKFLRLVRDHLVVKQKEADIAIEYLKAWGDQRFRNAEKAPADVKLSVFNELRRLKLVA